MINKTLISHPVFDQKFYAMLCLYPVSQIRSSADADKPARRV